MNKVAKGNRIENLAKKSLEDLGWLVDKKPRTKFNSPDFFGLFDLLCIRGGDIKLIQIKSNRSDFYKARGEIAEWAQENGITLQIEIWLYEGKGEWRKEELHIEAEFLENTLSYIDHEWVAI